jgi:hypothetical protein
MSTSRTATALLTLLLAASPGAADWLVTRDGGRVETRGPWQIKGKLVVFTQANGTLSSLRLTEVDLDASARATAEAGAKAGTPPEEKPKPRPREAAIVITDADFRRPEAEAPPAAAAGTPVPPSAGGADEKPREQGPVTVSTWRQEERTEGDGLDLYGALLNRGPDIATGVVLTVRLFNEAGEEIAAAAGILASTSIRPGGAIDFRVPLPGVFTFAKATFDVESRSLTVEPLPEEDGEGGSAPPTSR